MPDYSLRALSGRGVRTMRKEKTISSSDAWTQQTINVSNQIDVGLMEREMGPL